MTGLFVMCVMVALAVLAFGVFVYFVSVNNRLVALDNDAKRAWGNIDVLLQRRFDELEKLVKTVKSYKEYEEKLVGIVAEARKVFAGASQSGIAAKAAADASVAGAFKALVAFAENYPDLKANTVYVSLMSSVTDLERSLAERRELYNAVVATFNTAIAVFPNSLIAARCGFGAPKELFKVDEAKKADPKFDI